MTGLDWLPRVTTVNAARKTAAAIRASTITCSCSENAAPIQTRGPAPKAIDMRLLRDGTIRSGSCQTVSSRLPVRTKNPSATDRADGLVSPISRSPSAT